MIVCASLLPYAGMVNAACRELHSKTARTFGFEAYDNYKYRIIIIAI